VPVTSTFTYVVPQDAEVCTLLTTIPGVTIRNGALHAPVDAAWIVEAFLRSKGIEPAIKRRTGTQWTFAPPINPADDVATAAARRTLKNLKPGMEDWLAPHQVRGIVFTTTRAGTLVAHSTGSGKSILAVAACQQDPAGRVVIVTRPINVAKYVKEVTRICYETGVVVENIDDIAALPTHVMYVVVSWGKLRTLLPSLLALRPHWVVIDESHLAKGTFRSYKLSPAIARAAASLAKSAPRVILSTATPVKDRLRDIWSQIDMLAPLAVGRPLVFANFHLDLKPGTWGGLDTSGVTKSTLPILQSRLSFYMHVAPLEETHKGLPPVRINTIRVPITAQNIVSGKYNGGVDDDADIDDVSRTWSRTNYISAAESRLAYACAKKRRFTVGLVEEYLTDERKGKVVVFVTRRVELVAYVKAFQARYKGIDNWNADGAVDGRVRLKIAEAFNEHPGPCYLIGTGDSWAESVDLRSTDYATAAGLPYTPSQVTQWIGRFMRLNSDRATIFEWQVAEGTWDERIEEILLSKLPSAIAITGDATAGNTLAAFTKKSDDLMGDLLRAFESARTETK